MLIIVCPTEVEKELEKTERKPPGLPSKKNRGQETVDFLNDGRNSAGIVISVIATEDSVKVLEVRVHISR